MPKLAPAAVQRASSSEPGGEALDELLSLVAERTGADLRGQRPPMLARRAAVRVTATRAPSTEEYLARLRDDLAEPWAAAGGWLLLGEADWPPPAVARRLEVVDRAHRLFRVRAADEGSP